MIDGPRFQLSIDNADHLTAAGPDAERVIGMARRWAVHHDLTEPSCSLTIQDAIPSHAGLGSGTQLGLSVAAGLSAFHGLPPQSPQELAISVGRGLRSAVGTYGFAFGGLIVEQGKSVDDAISPLACRLDMPENWRFVLVRPHSVQGICGFDEAETFDALPSVPQATTDQLTTLAHEGIARAVLRADFGLFAESVYEYGRRSGECFAARQGGPFNGPLLAGIVQQIRELGHAGVGQSSWGPTVFIATPSDQVARQLISQLEQLRGPDRLTMSIAAPNNYGARIRVRTVAELPLAG